MNGNNLVFLYLFLSFVRNGSPTVYKLLTWNFTKYIDIEFGKQVIDTLLLCVQNQFGQHHLVRQALRIVELVSVCEILDFIRQSYIALA